MTTTLLPSSSGSSSFGEKDTLCYVPPARCAPHVLGPSSGTSLEAPGKQDTGQVAFYLPPTRRRAPCVSGPNSATRLEAPDDILELLHKFVGWRTLGDLGDTRLRYICVLQGQIYPNFNIEEELKKLKDLSSALTSKYEMCVARRGKLNKEYDDLFVEHVEKLVEQLPDIKDRPAYEHLPTETEKFQIEKAVQKKAQKKVQEVKQVEDHELAMHLQGLREILKPKDEECGKERWRLGRIDRLLSPVNDFIQILTEAAAKKSRLENVVDFEVVIGGKRKRLESQTMGTKQSALDLDNVVVSPVVVGDEKKKILESPTKDRKKLVDRKEVEDCLFKVLEEVGGKTLESSVVVDTEFRKKWDSVVDGLIVLLGY